MDDFKTRLRDEFNQLEDKLNKLNLFLASDKIANVDDVQAALLRVQVAAMSTYLQCLDQRIMRLT